MKKLAVIFLGLLLSFTSFAQEPGNLQNTKEKLVQYHDSGEYQRDQQRTITAALSYLKSFLKNNTAKQPLAVVLDIDETSLSNYSDMLDMDFGGTLKQICDAEGKGTDQAITSTLDLYRFAKQNGLAVFFITGRTENYRAATERNLQQVGFTNWDGLILKPENYHEKSAAPFKTQARNEIEKKGFKIVLNIGDQLSDLIGGHAEHTFKMPNPYYVVP